jgi:hypothetical protein
MYNVFDVSWKMSKRILQKGGVEPDGMQRVYRKPAKDQLLSILVSLKRLARVIVCKLGAEVDQKVEAQLVAGHIALYEKVLQNPEQALDMDVYPELFVHLSVDGGLCGFQQFTASPRKEPKVILFGSLEENVPVVEGDRRDTQAKGGAWPAQGDHCSDCVRVVWLD